MSDTTGDGGSVVVRGGTVHTQTERGTVEGDVLVVDGAVAAVGDVDAPADAVEVDATGMQVTPGLIDAHSHAGMAEWGEPEDGDFNEGTSATTPHVNALDGFHPRDEELQGAFRNGVTTVSARMGSGNVIGGIICSMKTYGDVADRMLIAEDGMKAAMGETPSASTASARAASRPPVRASRRRCARSSWRRRTTSSAASTPASTASRSSAIWAARTSPE